MCIRDSVYSVSPLSMEAESLPYYEALVLRSNVYVNPVKEFLKLDLTDRNPLHKPKDKEALTMEELEFRVEHNSYMDRKEMIMPLWKLSRRHIEELLCILLDKGTIFIKCPIESRG